MCPSSQVRRARYDRAGRVSRHTLARMSTQPSAPADAVPQPLVVRTVALDALGAADGASTADLPTPSTCSSSCRRRPRSRGCAAATASSRGARRCAIEVGGADRFADAERAWHDVLARAIVRDEVQAPGTGPVAFGSFAFDDESPAGGVVVVPRVVVGRRGGRTWLTTITTGARLRAAPRLADVVGPRVPPVDPGDVAYTDGAVSADGWRDVVASGIAAIKAGDVDKVVLARDVHARTEHPLDVAVGAASAWRRSTRRAGRSASTAWWARRPSCWSAPRRAWSPRACWRARSGAPATTRPTWPARRSWRTPPRTSRSTSTR